MDRGDDTEPRGRFGLPPEQPAPRALLSPLRAFVILASAGLVAWVIVAPGPTDLRGDPPSGPARAGDAAEKPPPPAEPPPAPPTETEALAAFRSLDGLRATVAEAGAGRLLAPGLSIGRLERAVPPGGRTREIEALSIEQDRIRIRQVIDVSSWEVDLIAEDVPMGRAHRRMGIEWTLSREAAGWRIASWTVVEDRAVVTDP